MNTPQPGEVYRHHSGTLYEVLQPVFDADTGEQLVMYRALKKTVVKVFMQHAIQLTQTGPRYIHTVANFMREGRFQRVK